MTALAVPTTGDSTDALTGADGCADPIATRFADQVWADPMSDMPMPDAPYAPALPGAAGQDAFEPAIARAEERRVALAQQQLQEQVAAVQAAVRESAAEAKVAEQGRADIEAQRQARVRQLEVDRRTDRGRRPYAPVDPAAPLPRDGSLRQSSQPPAQPLASVPFQRNDVAASRGSAFNQRALSGQGAPALPNAPGVIQPAGRTTRTPKLARAIPTRGAGGRPLGQSSKKSSAWTLLIFVLILLMTTGAGRELLELITRLINK